jgi:hypothetical protein
MSNREMLKEEIDFLPESVIIAFCNIAQAVKTSQETQQDDDFYYKLGILEDFEELKQQLEDGTAKIYSSSDEMWKDLKDEGII